jgi:hypothetical protein
MLNTSTYYLMSNTVRNIIILTMTQPDGSKLLAGAVTDTTTDLPVLPLLSSIKPFLSSPLREEADIRSLK